MTHILTFLAGAIFGVICLIGWAVIAANSDIEAQERGEDLG